VSVDEVPVRYDPSDHSKAIIDMPALEAAHAQKMAEANATLKRYDDERIAVPSRGSCPASRRFCSEWSVLAECAVGVTLDVRFHARQLAPHPGSSV